YVPAAGPSLTPPSLGLDRPLTPDSCSGQSRHSLPGKHRSRQGLAPPCVRQRQRAHLR
ncbi:hypothetical protein B0H17DRAFT_1072769, partial [Mycena rosella]